jgi:DNA-binding transcriptional LysR family regulator
MDPRRLRLLVEFARLGSMAEVAAELNVTTSTVSQQLSLLAAEVGTVLLEPVGRRVRLTPAGRRLADHGVTILAAIEAAKLDLDVESEPRGTLRVAGFASAIRRSLLPVVHELERSHPSVRVSIDEYEPLEAFDLLASDDVDLVLAYDYTLAPASVRDDVIVSPLWQSEWGLGVHTSDAGRALADYADRPWIVNSRNTADEDAVRTLASIAGFVPRIAHRIDSLELVEALIAAGLGVGLLPLDWDARAGVRVLPITEARVLLRAFSAVRRGREQWPLLRLVLERIAGSEQRLLDRAFDRG